MVACLFSCTINRPCNNMRTVLNVDVHNPRDRYINHFTSGTVIPIVKDKRGDISSTANYRPITISSTISKIFEYLLLDSFSSILTSDNLQFGYKTSIGCPDAIFLLRRVIQHFNDRDSTVYIASIDASKAFDRVNHYKLFSILIKKGLPPYLIQTLTNWYSRLNVRIKWFNSFSSSLNVLSGVRQGGVLSGILFNLYVDNILKSLRNKDLGCHMFNMFIGATMYADDLILLSASLYDLQTMLDICNTVGSELGINFNPIKSHCIAFGPNYNTALAKLILGSFQLPWVNKIEYLGVTLASAKSFQIDLSNIIRKFFTSTNTILSKCSYTSDFVKLQLLEPHALHILLNATESLNLPNHQLTEINSWWNRVYRKIFGYQKWESVRSLISFSGRVDIHHIVNFRTLKFIIKMNRCSHTPVATKEYLTYNFNNGNECTALFKKYDCYKLVDIYLIKKTIYNNFHNST